jgi:hypothetical protein
VRASDQGFLPISLEHYAMLLDWTGRQLRADKRGAIPDHLAPIMERLALNRSKLGGNRARVRPTVQAGGGATEFAHRRSRTPLATLVPGQGGGSNRFCVDQCLDAQTLTHISITLSLRECGGRVCPSTLPASTRQNAPFNFRTSQALAPAIGCVHKYGLGTLLRSAYRRARHPPDDKSVGV